MYDQLKTTKELYGYVWHAIIHVDVNLEVNVMPWKLILCSMICMYVMYSRGILHEQQGNILRN